MLTATAIVKCSIIEIQSCCLQSTAVNSSSDIIRFYASSNYTTCSVTTSRRQLVQYEYKQYRKFIQCRGTLEIRGTAIPRLTEHSRSGRAGASRSWVCASSTAYVCRRESYTAEYRMLQLASKQRRHYVIRVIQEVCIDKRLWKYSCYRRTEGLQQSILIQHYTELRDVWRQHIPASSKTLSLRGPYMLYHSWWINFL